MKDISSRTGATGEGGTGGRGAVGPGSGRGSRCFRIGGWKLGSGRRKGRVQVAGDPPPPVAESDAVLGEVVVHGEGDQVAAGGVPGGIQREKGGPADGPEAPGGEGSSPGGGCPPAGRSGGSACGRRSWRPGPPAGPRTTC